MEIPAFTSIDLNIGSMMHQSKY